MISVFSFLLLINLLLILTLCSSSSSSTLSSSTTTTTTSSSVAVKLLEMMMTYGQFDMFLKDMEVALDMFHALNRINNNNEESMDSSNRKLLQINDNGESSNINISPEIIDTLKNYQPKTALKVANESCNQQLCQMYESALSCKVIGINLKKICAQYITSFLYDCSSPFPAFYEIYQAPFYCISEITDTLQPLIAGLKGGGGLSLNTLLTANGSFLANYINSDFGDNCRRNCFQTYLNATVSFYSECYPLLFQHYSSIYKVPFQLNHFQTLRDQVCVENNYQQNCYDLGTTMLKQINGFPPDRPILHPSPVVSPTMAPSAPPNSVPTPTVSPTTSPSTNPTLAPTIPPTYLPASPTPSPTAMPTYLCSKSSIESSINIYDPQCTYIYYTNANCGFDAIKENLCSLFDFGQCYGNIVNMIATTQLISNSSALTILPPCLLKFLNANCNLQMSNIATEGASTSMSIFNGFIQFDGKGCVPNVYDKYIVQNDGVKNGFLGLQGALLYTFQNHMLATGLNYSAPLQASITNFTYYQKDGIGSFTQLIEDNGVPPLNPREYIYSLSNKTLRFNFSYSIFLPNLNSTIIELIYNCSKYDKGCLLGAPFGAPSFIVGFDFCGKSGGAIGTTYGVDDPIIFAANPFITTKNAANNNFHGYTIAIIATSLLLLYYAI